MTITVVSKKKTEFIDITESVQRAVTSLKSGEGTCMLYVPHTTAAVTVNEGADPSVKADILTALNAMVPENTGYRHMEGNSTAHVKSTLVGVSELIAVKGGRLVLGTWQSIFFCEFDGPRKRKVHISLMEGLA